MTDLNELEQVVCDLHGEATNIRSKPDRQTFQGETVWDGVVAISDLRGHAV
jgi:hypothetical protein